MKALWRRSSEIGLLVIEVLQGGSHEGESHREKQRCQEAEITWPTGEHIRKRRWSQAPSASDGSLVSVSVYCGSSQLNHLVLTSSRHSVVKEKRAPLGVVCFLGDISLLDIIAMIVLSIEMSGFLKGYTAHS